jgi:hypothetical protein
MLRQTAEHEVNHGNLDEGLTGFGQELVILAESAIAAQPGKGSFNDPAMGQNFESFLGTRPRESRRPMSRKTWGPRRAQWGRAGAM